jgi:hypothetical protein
MAHKTIQEQTEKTLELAGRVGATRTALQQTLQKFIDRPNGDHYEKMEATLIGYQSLWYDFDNAKSHLSWLVDEIN